MAEQLFTDSIYPPEFVDGVNQILNNRAPACQTYLDIVHLSEQINGCGLDTAPRDLIAELIIDELKLDNAAALARVLGYRTHRDDRPRFWRGVDSREFWPETGCEIGWLEIEAVAEAIGPDPLDLYAFFCSLTSETTDKEEQSALACQGLAALNYYKPEGK